MIVLARDGIPGRPRYARSVNFAPRLRHGGVVVLLAVGLLAMHGLTSTSSMVEGPGHEAATVAVATEHGLQESLDHTMGGSAHDPFHDIGHACLWLLAGGAFLVVTRRFGSVAIERGVANPSRYPLAWPRWSLLHHPPDSRLATAVLRC